MDEEELYERIFQLRDKGYSLEDKLDNIKEEFQKLKDLWKSDKKSFIKGYKFITEFEMFVNWKGWMYNEYPQISDEKNNSTTFGKLREKLHDFNMSKFDYDTEE